MSRLEVSSCLICLWTSICILTISTSGFPCVSLPLSDFVMNDDAGGRGILEKIPRPREFDFERERSRVLPRVEELWSELGTFSTRSVKEVTVGRW